MEQAEERAVEQPAGGPQAPAQAGDGGVSTGRKVRLAVLVAVLVALTAFALAYRSRLARQERQEQERVATALADLRRAVEAIRHDAPAQVLRAQLAQAAARYYAVQQLEPGNPEADRLGVALSYAQGSALEAAVQLFNSLEVRQIGAEIGRDAYARAAGALDSFPGLAADAASTEIHGPGKEYLQRTGFLWGAARAVVPAEGSERDRAMRLLRWMALHVGPATAWDLPAEPHEALFRGRASPVEAAWSFSELARQAELRCRVASVPPASGAADPLILVQLEPTDGAPFLVDPYRGVPLLDTEGGGPLSLEALAARPEAYGEFLALADGTDGEAQYAFGSATLKTALYPFACYPRFLVFDHLLEPLQAHPRVAAHPEFLAPGRPLELWEAPMEVMRRAQTVRPGPQAQRAYRALQVLQAPRVQFLQGHHEPALAGFTALSREIEAKRRAAEVAEAAALLDEALQHAGFFAAGAAFEAGDFAAAAGRLRAYLTAYPSGHWRAPAAAQLAECLSVMEEPSAPPAWQELPPPRRLHGALRQRGLLPGPGEAGQPGQ